MTTQHNVEPASLVGKNVGSYRISGELARGGMGVVYEAVHETLGHRAAVKVLAEELQKDPKYAMYAKRFFNEARALTIIQHPGIVKLYDHGQFPDGTVYILMEFLEGESLLARIESGGKAGTGQPWLPMADVFRIGRQIASALAAAHKKSIIHRDLKPANIMLVPDAEAPEGERAKILDFGIARFLDSPTRRTATGALMGTPTYMSPEQCLGSEVDEKTDVYSLGIIMYLMLVGTPPFSRGNVTDILVAHVKEPPPALRNQVSSIPEALHQLVHQMLAKPAADRPTMADVVARLKSIEQAWVTAASPQSTPAQDQPGSHPAAQTRMFDVRDRYSPHLPTRIVEPSRLDAMPLRMALIGIGTAVGIGVLIWLIRSLF